MNLTIRNLFAALALVTAAAAAPALASAVDCAKPGTYADVRGCEAAAQGIDTLRQFVWRTRAVYRLYIKDFVSAVPARVATATDKQPVPDAIASR